MDVSAFQHKEDCEEEEQWNWEEAEEDWSGPQEDGAVCAVGKGKGKGATRYNCGTTGHFARDCPKEKSKGKGKPYSQGYGPMYGPAKGKGKTQYSSYSGKGTKGAEGSKGSKGGKGPTTGCWDCGGSHYRGSPECPMAHQARSLEEQSREVKSLCSIVHHNKAEAPTSECMC